MRGRAMRPQGGGRDRFGIFNSFLTFGGYLYAERMDPNALLLVFRSSAPILRLAGLSQKGDVIADEILSFADLAAYVGHLLPSAALAAAPAA